MLITTEYQALNAHLHDTNIGYGVGGWHWIGPILAIARELDAGEVLDYGAGKGTLKRWMPFEFPVINYDPITFPADPPICDMAACLDVMEHIEPDCLNDVLRHIRSKVRKGALFVISTRLAQKTLQDGRNAHLIVEGEDYWMPKLKEFFRYVGRIPDVGRADELVLFAKV